MIIPIQREGSNSVPLSHPTSFKTTSAHTSKKSVRITPKITEIEMRPQTRPVVVQPKQQENFKPVSILSSSKSHDWSDMSNSALKMFEASNKRWAAENNVENNFLVPSFNTSTQSLFKDNKFDNFSNRIMTPMFQDHPIKIETFVTESDRYVVGSKIKTLPFISYRTALEYKYLINKNMYI